MVKPVYFILILFILSSCSSDEYEAEKAGQVFCECMKREESLKKPKHAYKVCNDELIENNKYYKTFEIDMGNKELAQKMTVSTTDSVKKFIYKFSDYTDKNCCQDALGLNCK